MIMWEFTTGKKPFHDRPHNYILISDILKGERLQITDDTPEFYAKLMKRCWDHNPENRPTAEEIEKYFHGYQSRLTKEKEAIKLAEAKRQEIKNKPQINYKYNMNNINAFNKCLLR